MESAICLLHWQITIHLENLILFGVRFFYFHGSRWDFRLDDCRRWWCFEKLVVGFSYGAISFPQVLHLIAANRV